MEKNAPTYSPKVDILIVGAGLSGLTAALKILDKERSLQVKILESSKTIGGQIADTCVGDGSFKWITRNQCHIIGLLEQLGVRLRKRNILAPNKKRCWDIDTGFCAILVKFELRRYLRELEIKMKQFRPSHHNSRSNKQTTISMHFHICNRLFFKKSRQFMMNIVQLICAMDAHDVSYADFMTICHSCGGLSTLIDIYVRCPCTLLEFSSKELMQEILNKLRNAEILYGRRVHEVRNYKTYVEVLDSESEVHTATAVILAVPWDALQNIEFQPSMPPELQRARRAQDMSIRMLTTFMIKYKEGHWRLAGYSGSFLCNEPLIVGYEYRPTLYGVMVMHAEESAPRVREMTLEALAQHFGKRMLRPESYCENSYTLSSMATMPCTAPFNRIIWAASTVSATCHRGRLGGAVQSGARAAVNALLMVRPQTLNWKDMADMQHCEGPYKSDAGWLQLWMSSLNLYNVSYYSAFVCGVVAVLRLLYKKHSF